MKQPADHTRNLLPMKALEPGESSHTHRVRASREANEWFSAMTAEQRGQIVTEAHRKTISKGLDWEPEPEPFDDLTDGWTPPEEDFDVF